MSTQAGTIGVSRRPSRFTLWAAVVSALAAAALVMSAMALTVAVRDDRSETISGTREAAISAPMWDAGKLEAMEARMLAETARAEGSSPLWDAGKLEAMEARMAAG